MFQWFVISVLFTPCRITPRWTVLIVWRIFFGKLIISLFLLEQSCGVIIETFMW